MWRHRTSTHNITPLFYPDIGADSVRGFYFFKLLVSKFIKYNIIYLKELVIC